MEAPDIKAFLFFGVVGVACGLVIAFLFHRSRHPLGVSTCIMRTTILILGLATLFLPACAEDPKTLESAGLGRKVLIRGQLGQPLGRVITIDGSAVERDFKRSKADQSAILFRVTKVDGQPLSEPRVIELTFFSFLSVRPPTGGEKRTFRGYEDGGFTGIPDAALKEMDLTPATADWHFSTHFRVIN